jgi:outer membrane protein TolC
MFVPRTSSVVAGLVGAMLVATPAHALDPLSRYLEGGRRHAAEVRVADADVETRRAEAKAERATLLPSLEASAGYTRNQFEIVARIPDGQGGFDEATFTPKDQLDATFTLVVPIFDLAAIRRSRSARALQDVAVGDRGDIVAQIDDDIAAAYTTLVAYAALEGAARSSIDAARANVEVVGARAGGGLASELDVRRAVAQVSSAEQALADAELQRRSAARRLAAKSGLHVSEPIPQVHDDLRAEPSVETWLVDVQGAQEVASARANLRASEATHRATRAGFVPQLAARASERITNAAGFGEPAQWAVGITLSSRFDLRTLHRARAARQSVRASSARYDLAVRNKRLEIEDAHDRVESLRVRARAAREQNDASQVALTVARARYEAGTGSQLEVVQALRDAFAAEASRIQADSELSYARVQLRLAAGRPVESR